MERNARYRQAFAKLKAPPQLETEVLRMTGQKRRPKKFIARRLAVAALAAALMGALAIGANAAAGGSWWGEFIQTITGGRFTLEDVEVSGDLIRGRLVDGQGNSAGEFTGVDLPEGSSQGDPSQEVDVEMYSDRMGKAELYTLPPQE